MWPFNAGFASGNIERSRDCLSQCGSNCGWLESPTVRRERRILSSQQGKWDLDISRPGNRTTFDLSIGRPRYLLRPTSYRGMTEFEYRGLPFLRAIPRCTNYPALISTFETCRKQTGKTSLT